MPLIEPNKINPEPFGGDDANPVEPEGASLFSGDLWSAAFIQENPIGSFIDQLGEPQFKPDPEFKLRDRLTASPFGLSHPRAFVGVRSAEEFDYVEGELKQEQDRRDLLASSGLSGIAASMAAGVLSPTMLLPVVGAARGAKAVASAAGYAALSGAIDEGVLSGTQDLRTAGESLTGFTTQFVLGTLLGSAAAALRPGQLDQIAGDMALSRGDTTILPEGPGTRMEVERQGVGAEAVRSPGQRLKRVSTPFGDVGFGAAGRWTSPIVRLAEGGYENFRWGVNQLESAGLLYEGAARGEPAAVGGTAASNIKWRHARAFEAVEHTDALYSKYFFDGREPTWAERRIALARGEAGATHGKLSLMEFRKEVHRALNLNDESSIPEAAEAARYIREHVLNPTGEELVNLRFIKESALDPETLKGGVQSYFHRMYNKNKIRAESDEFLTILEEHAEQRMREEFNKRLQKALEKKKSMEQEASDLSVSQEVREQLIEELQAEQTRLADEMPDVAEANASAKTLRSLGIAARKEGNHADADALLNRAREIEAEAGEPLKEFRGRDKAIRKRLRNLNRTYEVMEEKFARKLAQIDRQEEIIFNALRQVVSKARSTLRGLDRLDDAKLDKEIRALADRLEQAVRVYDKADDQIAQVRETLEAAPTEVPTVKLTKKQLEAVEPWGLPRSAQGGKKGEVTFLSQRDKDQLLASLDKAAEQATPSLRTSLQKLRQKVTDTEIPDAQKLAEGDLRAMELDRMQDQRADRLRELAGRLDEAEGLDREAARQVIEDTLEQTLESVNITQARRYQRLAKMRERADALDPQRVVDKVRKLNEGAATRLDAVLDRYRTTADDIVEQDGTYTATFKGQAREDAMTLRDRILGMTDRPPAFDLVTDPDPARRGAELARVLDIPFERIEPFLEQDSEKVVRSYARTTASDISIAEKFGDPNGRAVIERANDERANKIEEIRNSDMPQEKKDAAIAKVDAEYESMKRDFEAVIARLRHLRGIPENPEDLGYRLGKVAMDLNTLRLMGTVVPSSVADLGRVVMKHGIKRAYGAAFRDMVNGFKAIRLGAEEVKLAGTANDIVSSTRAQQITDIWDTQAGKTVPERAINFMAMRMGKIALFDFWNAGIKQFAGVVTINRLAEGVQKVVNGTAKQADLQFLAGLGIDDRLARKIADELQRPGGSNVVNGLLLPNTEEWVDREAKAAFRAAIAEDVDNTIVTPGAERPLFADANIGLRLLTQFRSFGYSSTTKTLMAGMQQGDMAALNGALFLLAGGALSYYIWAMSAGGRAREEMLEADLDKWMDEAIDRSGLLARLSTVRDVASRIPATSSYVTLSDERLTRRSGQSLVSMVAGPTYGGLVNELGSLAMGIDDPTKSTLHDFRQLMPYQNVFYLRQLLDKVEAAAGESAGLPEERG